MRAYPSFIIPYPNGEYIILLYIVDDNTTHKAPLKWDLGGLNKVEIHSKGAQNDVAFVSKALGSRVMIWFGIPLGSSKRSKALNTSGCHHPDNRPRG